tara:strand:- start:650 stop:952 length:303 start_codon:yes stop_codon:yes gene_type:complete
MSIAKNAQCSQIARNVESGKYAKQYKFSNFGSVAEDTIQGQQRLADERLKQIQAGKLKKAPAFPSDRPEMRDLKWSRSSDYIGVGEQSKFDNFKGADSFQ